jgi:hypothetical protein
MAGIGMAELEAREMERVSGGGGGMIDFGALVEAMIDLLNPPPPTSFVPGGGSGGGRGASGGR